MVDEDDGPGAAVDAALVVWGGRGLQRGVDPGCAGVGVVYVEDAGGAGVFGVGVVRGQSAGRWGCGCHR